jgi:Na+/H+ antiporter
MSGDLQSTVSLALMLLGLIAGTAVLAAKLRIPGPTLLVIVGVLISLVPHFPAIPLNSDLVLLILLPPLLFSAAWKTSWRDFRRNLVPLVFLAVGLVAFTVFGVAYLAGRYMPTLDWTSGFVLGAVVATTDAVAAGSVARMVRLPPRVLTILDGESLINDATGLLALELGITMLNRHTGVHFGASALELCWLIAGGIAAGLAVAVLLVWIDGWLDDSHVEMALSLIVPYAAYLVGQKIHGSGVLAVVTCGIYCSRRSKELFSPEVRVHVLEGWSAVDFLLNSFVSLLIGLQFPSVWAGISTYSKITLLEYGLSFSLLLIALRLIWMFPCAPLAHWVAVKIFRQKMEPFAPKRILLVGWTGMRGVVAMAAAFSLPTTLANGHPFKQRSLILFLTFSVIVVTLVVQGMTLATVIRWLGLNGGDSTHEEIKARRTLLTVAVRYLETKSATMEENTLPTYDDLLNGYRQQLSALETFAHHDPRASDSIVPSRLHHASMEIVGLQRRALLGLLRNGEIGDEVLTQLERELDLTTMCQQSNFYG